MSPFAATDSFYGGRCILDRRRFANFKRLDPRRELRILFASVKAVAAALSYVALCCSCSSAFGNSQEPKAPPPPRKKPVTAKPENERIKYRKNFRAEILDGADVRLPAAENRPEKRSEKPDRKSK